MVWAVMAAMTAAALAFLLPPLLRHPTAMRGRADFDMEVYRDQIEEIGRDLDRGQITLREAEDARTEIGRRLLAADRQSGDPPADPPAAAPGGRPRWMAAAVAAVVPVAALALYYALGSPLLPGATPGKSTVAGSDESPNGGPNAQQMAALVDQLGRKLAERPDDAGGWALYARSLAGLGRVEAARDAFARAVSLDPKNAELLSRFAEVQILSAKGIVSPQARRTLDAVLSVQSDEPRARYYMGLAEQQAGRRRKALDTWLALETETPPDAPWRSLLGERIGRLAREMDIDDAALGAMRATMAARPEPDQPGAMIHAMVARLAARLEKQPDDVDGWRRLARSYRVLGENKRARDALKRAVALAPDDLAILSDYAVAIVQAADRGGALPKELVGVTVEILKRNPKHPSALWYGGVARMQAGDIAGALEHWQRLQSLLKPGTPQHKEISKRIESLKTRRLKKGAAAK